MASKEEIDSRVTFEARKVIAVYLGGDREPVEGLITKGVRPLVERVIGLEEEGAARHAQLTRAEEDARELDRERARLTEKLARAEARVIELDRQVQAINADRSRILADLTEARAGWRTAEREHDETTAALRAQVAAREGVIDGHEQAILDACADVRAGMSREIDAWQGRCADLTSNVRALETTVDVLAGRLAARGA